MRVLHVTAYYAPAFVYGGPPRSIHALCRALRGRGVDVEVFTTDANGPDTLPASITGCPAFEGVPVRYFARTRPRAPIGSRALATTLRREIGRFDLLHVHGLWNRVVWAAAREAARAGVPYVLSPRGMLEPAARAHRRWRKQAGWALVDRRVVGGASLLHATSESERDTLLAIETGVPVACIPNGVEVGPSRRVVPGGPPLVLFIGRVHPIKRLDLLIDAFVAVRARRPDARLVIAGPDDSASRTPLIERAGSHAGAVVWAGAVDAARRQSLLAEAAVLVMCSNSESFGMSVLEAMAAAVPVVVTRTCPWADVERHEAGYWVDQTAPAIADAILRLVEDPRAAHAMGERGRALAASRYEWSGIAAAFAARYEALQLTRAVRGRGSGRTVSAGWSRAIVMTPRASGKDGVSAVTRLYAATLAERLGADLEALEIWSLDDEPGAAWTGDARIVCRGAAGGRLRFAALAAGAARVDGRTLVVVQHVHLLPVALPLAWRGARVVVLLHGVEAWKPLRLLERAGCHAAWKIAAVSAYTAARFRQANPALADSTVEVCAPGLPALPLAGTHHDPDPYALIVGRMAAAERYKGHDLVIDVWPSVRRAVPGARLLVVGGGDDRARLAAKAASLGLDGAVRFEGVVDDERLAALYQGAALFVMPSPGEGFGLVYVEAMSAGVPCIVAAGAAEEIVEDGATGLVVPAGDGAALERAIVRLLANPGERSRLGAAAAEAARRRFSAAAFAGRLQHLLELPPAGAAC